MNCKPGDLAVAVGSFIESNLGRVVEVLYACPQDGAFTFPDGSQGHYDGDCGPAWVCVSLGARMARTNTDLRSVYGAFLDAHLRPIRGLPETVTERESATA